jgi:drug/metabolite transporter (DMT)-like permease
MGLRDAVPPLAAAALWGGMYVVSKWGFGSVPAVTLAFLRVLVGAALGALLLGEALGPGFAAGGALMGVGVALVSTARAR